jgi:hypothetical protein
MIGFRTHKYFSYICPLLFDCEMVVEVGTSGKRLAWLLVPLSVRTNPNQHGKIPELPWRGPEQSCRAFRSNFPFTGFLAKQFG